MTGAFVCSHNIISPLGFTSEENFDQLLAGNSGVRLQERKDIDEYPIYASLFSEAQVKALSTGIKDADRFSFFEKLIIRSVEDASQKASIDISSSKTIFIFSTTKGNISLIENEDSARLYEQANLFHSASVVTNYFRNKNKPHVISNACISGSVALLFAKRLLESGQYENAIIAGADVINRFIYSGFQSFLALSAERCKPFSADREGINLGEAAATIILSTKPSKIKIESGAIINDANHISGPSRTGQELSTAIGLAMQQSEVTASDIDFISAHGTATSYNDEMEAKAFNISELESVPLHSLKGYFGHTLGAAGLLESIVCFLSLEKGIIIPSLGFTAPVLEPAVNVCNEIIQKDMTYCLKTASGFGGCNAALIFSKS